MKRNVTILLLLLTVVLSACSSTTTVSTRRTANSSKPLPPGQAKKVNGDKSARAYAPGQNKG
ncbi:MAG: hypothetical protein V4581_16240 [Bacteroidota bacterium]